jgi:hypothetical protein
VVTDSYLIERIGMVTEEGNEWGKMGVKKRKEALGGCKSLKKKDVMDEVIGSICEERDVVVFMLNAFRIGTPR